MRSVSLPILLVLVSVAFLSIPVQADTFTWIGLGDDNYWVDTTGNWETSSSEPYPGYLNTSDTAVFGDVHSQSFTPILENNLSLGDIIFNMPGYTFTVTSSPVFRNGITATYSTAPNLENEGYIYFNGTITVMNLTGFRGGFFSDGGTSNLTALGTGTYTGVLQTDEGIGTFSLTVGDAIHTASLTLANNIGVATDYTGTTLVNANATLVGGTAGSLAALSPHVINGTLSLSSSNTVGSLSGTGTVNLGANTLTINSGGTTFGGSITGTGGSLVKSGTGTLNLSGTNSYTGSTIISGGRLSVNGSIAGGAIVQTGAELGGSGTIGGAVTVQSGGTLSPGNSPGKLTFSSSLTLNSGSLLNMEFNGTTPGLYDQMDVQGLFTAGGTLQLTIDSGYTPTIGDSFTIFDGATPGIDSGNFSSISTNLGSGLQWDTSALASSGVVTIEAVPEPSTWGLILLGVGGLCFFQRRRRIS